MRRFYLSAALAAAVVFISSLALAQQPVSSNDAKVAVERWLRLMDNGEYEACYAMLSSVYIDSIKTGSPNEPKRYWVRNMGTARSSLGLNESRRLFRMTPARQLISSRGSSRPGSYIIFDFQSSFSNEPEVNETISAHLENGEWKISSYIFN